jgi:C4-type Zn-finger protein
MVDIAALKAKAAALAAAKSEVSKVSEPKVSETIKTPEITIPKMATVEPVVEEISEPSDTSEHEEYNQIFQKIEDLKTALQEAIPGYEQILFTIHRNLASDPDVIHILSEEQIGVIVSGLSKKKAIHIVETKTKASKSRKITEHDL